MWQRFTERARRIILLAQEEAGRMNSGHVGTEHLLLGLVRENEGVAAQILQSMDVSLAKVRQEIEAQVQPETESSSDEPKLTPKAKRVLELAADEARRMRHNYIGTEHLLLALLREKNGLAATTLQRLGLDLEKARTQVLKYLGPDESIDVSVFSEAKTPRSTSTRVTINTDFSLTPEAMLLLGLAAADAIKNGEALLSPKHILLAIIENTDGEIAQLLQSLGLNLEEARAALRYPPQTEPHQVD